MIAAIQSVNVSRVRAVAGGGARPSAIDKLPVEGPLQISALGLDGDEQADRKHHGGVDQAVYAFPREELDGWAKALGRDLRSGTFGENLTTIGLDVNGALIGERWQIGEVLLEVTSPRIPCSVFQDFIGEADWIRRFSDLGRPGAYLRVLHPGTVQSGDPIVVKHRPDHGVTLADAFRARSGASELVPRLLAAPELSRSFREWAERRLSRP